MSATTVTLDDRLSRQRAKLVREGAAAADRIVAQVCNAATGPKHLLTLLAEAEARVENGPAPQVFKDAFADRVIALCDGGDY